MNRILLLLLPCVLLAQIPDPVGSGGASSAVTVAALPTAATAVVGLIYRWTGATSINSCPAAGAAGSGGSAVALCVTHDGTAWQAVIEGGTDGSVTIGSTLSAGKVQTKLPETGLLADYQLLEGAGTTVADSSGNAAAGTFLAGANAPTWLSGGGVRCGASAVSGISLPSSVNVWRTFMAAVYPTTVAVTAPTNQPTRQTVMYATPSSAIGIYSPGIAHPNFANYYGMSIVRGSNGIVFDRSDTLTVGPHILTWQLGSASDSTLDTMYADGVPASTYTSAQGTSAGLTDAGVTWQLCGGTGNASNFFNGKIYRAAMWSGFLTATQVAAATEAMRLDLRQQGVGLASAQNTSSTPQLIAVGDSITSAGTGGTPYTSQLTGLVGTWTITNFGVNGEHIDGMIGQAPDREDLKWSPVAAQNVIIFLGGANDTGGAVYTDAQLASRVCVYAQQRRARGYRGKLLVGTNLSKTGAESHREALNTYIRRQWQGCGWDGVADFAEDPNLGADGAYANTTYFNVDGLHPKTAGYALMGAIAARSVNAAFSSVSATEPTLVTGTTYTILDADLFTRIDSTANNVTVTLPTCIGTSFRRSIKRADASANAVTVAAAGSELIDGSASITIAARGSVLLAPIADVPATAGCHWEAVP